MRVLRAPATIAVLLVSLALTGCGDDKKAADTTAATATSFDVSAKDFAFDGPTTVKAGRVRVNFRNGGQTFHQVTLARITDGSSTTDLIAAAKADPGGGAAITHLALSGGINGIAPGASQAGETSLDPGMYVMICFIPGADGQNYASKGMVAPFTVTGSTPASSPVATGTKVTLKDYSFAIPPIQAEPTTLDVTNDGPQPHELAIYKVSPGKTANDVLAFLTAAPSARPPGPPPFALTGGVAALDKSRQGSATITFERGTYIAACLVPDPATHKPHVALGMLQTFDVP